MEHLNHKVAIALVSNLYVRAMTFERAGMCELGHSHTFDHLTLLATGSIRLTVDGVTTDFKAPHMIYIAKDKVHELEALEDNTVAYCVHALRKDNGSGDILDPSMIPKGADAFAMGIAAPLIHD